MEFQPFIKDIRTRAGLMSDEEAIGAAEATLETLGEVLDSNERDNIADNLPDNLASALERNPPGQHLAHDEFYERVTQREKQGRGLAMEHAQAVCQALAQALPSEKRTELRAKVPEDYRYLFEPPATAKSPPGNTKQAQQTERVAKPQEVGGVTRKGDLTEQPPKSARPVEIEDTQATRKVTSHEASPTPEASPQSDEGREKRSDKS